MTYQVLARKWRPQGFSGLIGQEPIVTALRNGLTEGRIAQAYLFSGIRGVGKTSAARVLAKALNCEKGPGPRQPAPDPCNECPSCLGITAGNNIDFLEVDAATYSKVEQIRELTESLRYGPARGRYKIVVLDEVHRLSRQAFDALLKIVEEPPAHLVFIFATTESDAVPATILSRCQEFQFRRVPSAVLAEYLRQISEAEEIEARDTALRLIARAGEGSVRDSVALLDQLATFGSGKISDKDAKNLLGGLDAAVFLRLLEAILAGRGLEISEIVHEIEALGWDPYSVYGQFLTFARDGLQLAMGAKAETIDLPLEEAQALAELAKGAGYEGLLRLTQLLLESEESVRRSEFGMLAVQIAWLRAAELPKVVRIEHLLSGSGPGTPQPPPGAASGRGGKSPAAAAARSRPRPSSRPSGTAGSAGAEPASAGGDGGAPASTAPLPAAPMPAAPMPAAPADVEPPAAEPPRAEPPGPPVTEPPEAEPPASRPVSDFSSGPSRVPQLLQRVAAKSPSLFALLNSRRGHLRFEGGELLVPKGDSQLSGALHRPHNRELFEQLIHEVWGEGAGWGWSAAEAEPRPAETATDGGDPMADDAVARAHEDPVVQAVLEVFNGSKIQSVRPRPQGEDRP